MCDVHFLPPQRIQPGETPIQFCARVKELIAKRVGLVNVQWDGYLKHFTPSQRYVQARQKHLAASLLKSLHVVTTDSTGTTGLQGPSQHLTQITQPPSDSGSDSATTGGSQDRESGEKKRDELRKRKVQ